MSKYIIRSLYATLDRIEPILYLWYTAKVYVFKETL